LLQVALDRLAQEIARSCRFFVRRHGHIRVILEVIRCTEAARGALRLATDLTVHRVLALRALAFNKHMGRGFGPASKEITMKFSSLFAKVAAVALALAAAGTATVAQARSDVYFSIGANVAPGVVIGASNYYPPVYVQPQPVYVQPAPVYYGGYNYAPPVYAAPVYAAPVYVRPAPIYYSAPAPIYYGPRHGGYKQYGQHRHGGNKHYNQRRHGRNWR
jgi:hypothetical protein